MKCSVEPRSGDGIDPSYPALHVLDNHSADKTIWPP